MKVYDAEYYRLAKVRQRAKVINFLGGQCAICGSVDGLEIDHGDRSKKSFDVSKRMSLRSPEVLAELGKCQLLCGECHGRKTAAEQRGFTHGTVYGWMKEKCGCNACQARKLVDQEKKNAARRTGVRGPYRRVPEHGTSTMYRTGCRCTECREAHAERARKSRARG